MIPDKYLLDIQNKFLQGGVDISTSTLAQIVDGFGNWNACSNNATPTKKKRVGVISNNYSGLWVVTVHDLYLDVLVTWKSSERAEHQKDYVTNKAKIKKEYEEAKQYESTRSETYLRQHKYSTHKNIDIINDPYVKIDKHGNLLIPLTHDGVLVGLQYINKDATEKKMRAGTIATQSYLHYKATQSNKICYVCEGWADGKILNTISKQDVFIGFSAYGLLAAVQQAKKICKDCRIVLVADNDSDKDTNRGLEKALETATLEKIKIVLSHTAGDVSDIFSVEGAGAVLEMLKHEKTPEEITEVNIPDNYVLKEDGIYYSTEKNLVKICSPIKVIAQSCDIDGNNWGRVIEIQDTNKKWHKTEISIENLIANERNTLAVFAYYGARVVAGKGVKEKLINYIQDSSPTKKIIISKKTGWIQNSNTFLTQNRVIGQNKESYIFRGDTTQTADHIDTKGTVQEWNNTIVKISEHSSRLLFSIGLALAAPLATKLEKQGFNVHFFGISSTGKSTLGKVASSVFGHGTRFMNSWKTTTNALESTAMAHNDLLLVLDEISQTNNETVLEAIYMLANGTGKARSTKTGSSQNVRSWNTIGISNGEYEIKEITSKSYHNRFSYAGGIEVRMISLPADVNAGLGIFETAPSNNSRQLIEELQMHTNDYYGTIGVSYIEYLAYNIAKIKTDYEKFCSVQNFLEIERVKKLTQQGQRVYKNFELACFAGILAIEIGLLKVERELFLSAFRKCFLDWQISRGGGEAREKNELIQRVETLLEKNMFDKFITPHTRNMPKEFWGGVLPIDDNNNILNSTEVEIKKENKENYYEVYFIKKYVFDEELKGTLTTKQALLWLEEQNMLLLKTKDESALKRQGRWIWMQRISNLPVAAYYVIKPRNKFL